jgi:hypothetical protein
VEGIDCSLILGTIPILDWIKQRIAYKNSRYIGEDSNLAPPEYNQKRYRLSHLALRIGMRFSAHNVIIFWFFLVSCGGVRLSPFGTGLLYQPQMIDDECGAVGGIRIGRGNRSTRIKPAPVPLCPPQIPHDLTCARSRVAAVGTRRLTVWAMART